MKILGILSLLLSFSAFADQGLTTQNQKIKCIGVGSTTFSELKLKIDANGKVNGTYSGYQAGAGRPIKLFEKDSNIAWMQLENAPVVRLGTDGRIEIKFLFLGSMGNDQDEFTFKINRKNGKATLFTRTIADCGDGKWEKSPNEFYQCSVIR